MADQANAPPFVNTTFSPAGIQQVADHLLRDTAFAGNERRAKAMAMAYFASGAHDDGQHDYATKLHPLYRTFRHGYTEDEKHRWTDSRQDYLDAMMDMATTWDRFTTGVTWMLHSDATRRPNAPIEPTEATIHVYAPPSIINSVPSAPFALARAVQLFVEGTVLDAMKRWDNLTNKRAWSKAGPAANSRAPHPSLLPASDSTHFIFRGRPADTLEPLIQEYLSTRTAYVWSIYEPPPKTVPAQPSTTFAPPPTSTSPPTSTPPPTSTSPPTSTPPPPSTPPTSTILPTPARTEIAPVFFGTRLALTRSSPPVSEAPTRAALSCRQEKAPAVASSSLQSIFGNDGDPFAETDMLEALRHHSFESFDYTDQIRALERVIRQLNSNAFDQELELQRLRASITQLQEENSKLKEQNAMLVPEIFGLRLANIAKPRQHSAALAQTSADTVAAPIDDSDLDAVSTDSFSSVSSVATSVQSQARSETFSRSSTPGGTFGSPHRSRSGSQYNPVPRVTVQGPSRPTSAATVRSMTIESGVAFQMVNPGSPSRHRRLTPFGPATRHVLAYYNFDATMHRGLWDIEDNVLDDEWPEAVGRLLGTPDDEIIAAVVQAMMTDSSCSCDVLSVPNTRRRLPPVHNSSVASLRLSYTDPVALPNILANVSCPSLLIVCNTMLATPPGIVLVPEPTAVPVASSVVPVASSAVPVASPVVPVASPVVPVASPAVLVPEPPAVPVVSSVVPVASSVVPVASSIVPVASSIVPVASSIVPIASSILPVASPVVPVASPVVPVASPAVLVPEPPAVPVASSVVPVASSVVPITSTIPTGLPALPVAASIVPAVPPAFAVASSVAPLRSTTANVASPGIPALSPTTPITSSTASVANAAAVSAATPVATAAPPTTHVTSPAGVSGPSRTAMPAAPPAPAVRPPITLSYGPTSRVIAQPPAPTKRKEAPKIPAAQRAAITAASRNKQQQLQQELDTWYDGVQQFASQLSERYGHKPEHYMNLLFSGGAKMRKERKPNAYNAWSYAIAKEINEDAEPGEAQRMLSMQSERIDEYHALTDQEKAKFINQLQEERQSRKFGTRLTQAARTADMTRTGGEIEKLLYALKNRSGVEAFVCIVRNNNEFHAPPYWYFTDMRLDRFLRGRIRGWDCVTIASLSEAFSVAGCDFASYYTTSKDKADHIKGEIRDRIREMLCTETGNKKAVMNYVNHEKDVVLRYGVELVGYHPSFVNPSSLTSSLPTLRNLLAAIDDGTCHFRRVPPNELRKREQDHDAKVRAGEIAPRKKRSDAGKTHAKRQTAHDDGDGSNAEDALGGDEGPVAVPSLQETPTSAVDHQANGAVAPRKRGRPRKQPAPVTGDQDDREEPSRPSKRSRKIQSGQK
ncbi:hypothetical protein PYCCODRAFT_1429195 [Trametes coccinea BRFM310]|uniref:Uncharacterized protein n=1 Tax=Trametes coccinea (strain BRFM310) TaxID=1353009 RepID=A0A1Y2I6J4_TRAC3|nr:hypothetical protein PYCCODRAFT_1429195 [Trametes coccinea BRFM310]